MWGPTRYQFDTLSVGVKAAPLAFSPDGRTLAVGSAKGIQLWQLQPGTPATEGRFLDAPHKIHTLRFAPQGPWLAALDDAGWVTLYDTGSGAKLRSCRVAPEKPLALSQAPDGRHALVAAGDGKGSLAVVQWWSLDGAEKELAECAAVLHGDPDRRDPKSETFLARRARIMIRRGRFDLARTDVEALVRLVPASKEGWWLRAMVRQRHGDCPGCLSDLEQVIKIDPKDALAHFERGLLLGEISDYRGARRSLDEAFRLDPRLARRVDALISDKEPKE